MPKFKDLFISYGRRESLGFVARLHQQLKLAGYDAWFDKINIPISEDYINRINHGIESAHNFIYVMAPHSLCSPYCLMELEYARLLGKRVIPINHNVVFSTDKGILSEEVRQELTHFYQTHAIPNPHIENYQQLLDRSLKQVGQANWLPAKETLSDQDCAQLEEWAKNYETHWHHHDDINYLHQVDLPQFGYSIDSLGSVITLIKNVLERYKDYVHQHTLFLYYALIWRDNQYLGHYLLIAEQQKKAKNWLLVDFVEGEQAPCKPNALVCQFICASRKNTENRMTDCFICYDQHDSNFAHTIITTLSRHVITTWQYDTDIQKGKMYQQVIEKGIESANTILFFLSPSSITSDSCHTQFQYALKHNKRIIPLLITPTPLNKIPFELKKLQYIDFTNQNYKQSIVDLLHSLKEDNAYFTHHRILLLRALAWQRSHQKPSFLLRGYNLENAKTWLSLNINRSHYAPTTLHHQLINHSEASKGQLGTDVFISYSRKDGDFARQLNFALQEAGKTVWFDQESIATGVDFEAELYKGINGADNFIFIISPDSINSPYCESEVRYATSHCKRMITILVRETQIEQLPQVLQKINWLDFVAQPFEKQFSELIQTIELDKEHAHQHTILQQRALEWQDNHKSQDYLFNQSACEKAEIWLKEAKKDAKLPAPTQIQKEYIIKSRQIINEVKEKEQYREKKQRYAILITSITIGVMISMFAWWSWTQRNEALNTRSIYLASIAEKHLQDNKPSTAIKLTLDGLPNHSETATFFNLHSKQKQPITQVLYDAILQHWQGILEHDAPVKQVIFTQDNKTLISIAGNSIYIWDKNSLQLLYTLKHKDIINAITLSPNGKLLSSASDDKTAHLWDMSSGKILYKFQHDADVNHVTFSPDGQLLSTASSDSMTHLWEVHSGKCVHTFKHEDKIWHSAFSPNGQLLSTISLDSTARLWDVNSGKLLNIFRHGGDINHVTFSPDSKLLSTVSSDNLVRLWTVHTGRLFHIFKHDDKVWHSTFSPDGTLLSTVSNDKTARLWKISTGTLLHLFQHQDAVWHSTFSPDGNLLSTASDDKTSHVWDIHSGKVRHTVKHTDNVNYASFSPDGELLSTASSDSTVRLWAIKANNPPHTLKHKDIVWSATFSPNGKLFSSTSSDKTAQLWDIALGKVTHTFKHDDIVWNAIFSPDSQLLSTASSDKTVRLWDVKSGKHLHTLKHKDKIWRTLFSPDGTLLSTISPDNIVRLWDINSGKIIHLFKHEKDINYTAFSPNNKLLGTASSDNTARLWEIQSGQVIHTLKHKNRVEHVTFSPNGQLLSTVSYNTANIWEVSSGKLLHTFKYDVPVSHATFSPNGQLLSTSSYDRTARVWNVKSGKIIHIFEHQDVVQQTVFSPNSQLLNTVSYDNTTRIWDLKSGQLLYAIKGHKNNINDASFSPDGKKIVTASEDGTTRVWPIFNHLNELAEYAQQLFKGHYLNHHLPCATREEFLLEEVERCKE